MNGQEVYKFAVREVPLIIENLLAQTKYKSSEIDCFIASSQSKNFGCS